MATPIRETPVLEGKDAIRFLEKMYDAETKPITKEEREEYRQGRALYDRIKEINKTGI